MTGKGGHRDLERRDSELTWFFSHPLLDYLLLAGATFLSVWVSAYLAFNFAQFFLFCLFLFFVSSRLFPSIVHSIA